MIADIFVSEPSRDVMTSRDSVFSSRETFAEFAARYANACKRMLATEANYAKDKIEFKAALKSLKS